MSHNRKLGSALLEAVQRGDGASAAHLLSRGADPDVLDGAGRSALWWATATCDSKTVTRFLAAGARPDLADSRGRTPFWTALVRGDYGMARSMKPRISTEDDVRRLTTGSDWSCAGGSCNSEALSDDMSQAYLN